jgi:hypothetical protein
MTIGRPPPGAEDEPGRPHAVVDGSLASGISGSRRRAGRSSRCRGDRVVIGLQPISTPNGGHQVSCDRRAVMVCNEMAADTG